VDEIDVLRGDAENLHAARLFADMSADNIRQAIMVVARIPDEKIRQAILDYGGGHALAEKMIARKADMARRLVEAQQATERPEGTASS
jgi:hypothetical protein